MSIVGLGDMLTWVDVAAKTYTYGFSRAQRAQTRYNEFGDHVKGLAANLDDLQKIVGSVGQGGPQLSDSSCWESLVDIMGDYGRTIRDCDRFVTDNKERFSWEGDFVSNIAWNFSVASEVQALKDRVAFLNIKLITLLKTVDLQMASQLQINIFRIHQDLAMRIDAAQETIIPAVHATGDGILEYWKKGTAPSAVHAGPAPALLDIPYSLEPLFEQQFQRSCFYASPDQFPLCRGLDAVVYHIYTAGTIAADNRDRKRERQWLAIAKALWTIAGVRWGREYRDACAPRAANSLEQQMNTLGITVARYAQRLEMEVADIVRRLEINAATPDAELIHQVFEENPDMWLEVKEETGPTPTWELEYSENILDASLRGPYRGFDQSLHVFKLTDVDLKLVITDTPNSNGNGPTTNNIMNVDIRRCRFIPLYAANNSPLGAALNITFQGDRLGSGSSALVFNKRSELLKFQHAITGYQVVLESSGVGVVTYAAARVLGGSHSEYTGCLQLWRAKRPQNSTENGTSTMSPGSSSSTGSASTVYAPMSPSTTLSSSPQPNRNSITSLQSPSARNVGSRYRDSSISFIAELEDTNATRLVELPGDYPPSFDPHAAPTLSPPQSRFARAIDQMSRPKPAQERPVSQFSTVSALSVPVSSSTRRDSTFTVSSAGTSTTAVSLAGTNYTTSVVSADGTVGLVLSPPLPSQLVLLLQKTSKRGGTTFSTLAIEIDASTTIDTSACKCRSDPNGCLRVVIQRAGGGTLTSARQDAGADLDAWNLAALGGAQRKDLEKAKEKLAWVALDLALMEEKRKFVRDFARLRVLLVKEREAYNRTMVRLRV